MNPIIEAQNLIAESKLKIEYELVVLKKGLTDLGFSTIEVTIHPENIYIDNNKVLLQIFRVNIEAKIKI